MSDSDDTDILLLIPPDLFLSTSLSANRLNESFPEDYINSSHMSTSNWEPVPPPTLGASSGAVNFNQFLPPTQQIELDNINARLTNIETNFSPPSDLSTISNSTHCNGGERRTIPRTNIVTHSTPKDFFNGNPLREGEEYHGVLKEIDHFLEDRKYHSLRNSNNNRDYHHRGDEHHAASLPNVINRGSIEEEMANPIPAAPARENLVSLSEMWSKNAPGNLTLKEEQYRRLHLEKTIRTLQSKLLEYQQKISVALEVDRSKDNALRNAQIENDNLHQEAKRLMDTVTKIENDHQCLAEKYEVVQKELAQALGLAAKFQDKNEKLENELQDYSRKSSENSSFYKKKIEELEIMLHSCKKSEEYSSSELAKMKDRLAKSEYRADKASNRCEDLESQLETLKSYKEQAQELMQKHKNRADSLEEQKKTLNEKVSSLTEKESALQKKLESQRQGLKLHYQQQLEIVVAQKLKEFQGHLDKVEETLKQEGRDRERLIAERAMKQMELINDKNEQELNLLQQKHEEEVELYRLQLANASKKIAELESKLNSYKTKRADIAEKLHSVMEVQWQKALEILTSPNSQTFENKAVSTENVQSTAENEQFETPKSSRQNRAADELTNADRLQAYIELLLSKSPEDIDNLNDLLSKTKLTNSGSKNKNQQRLINNNGKPPWKG
ncbi:probable DNA double-strand break repair Rad50 ATPase [Eupeodes corollae]|uniref:probable DNA double-strand break repair Rad50 ATPase n=1 Tax=Eupeodes corollae TaxID=290404 RepID=UPI0024936AB5|nr:probable DNA double-strand break repair Rad50 ATPase [Eupeodes corollae]